MPGRIVEITQDGRSVHLDRGFLVVREAVKGGPSNEVGRIPITDIDAVIASTHGIMWSNAALAALANQNTPVVILAHNYAPAAAILPISGHHAQGHRFEAQANATRPMGKRLWAELVKAKIMAQAAVAATLGLDAERLNRLAKSVRSGDPDNAEAQAAQYYWPLVMGHGFKRERDLPGVNGMLNYGYAILRAASARAIVAAGLHPSLGIHHKSGGDALRLADDIMEPFRPAIDLLVIDLIRQGFDEITPECKRALCSVIQSDFKTNSGMAPLSWVLVRLSQSLVQNYTGESVGLDLPLSPLPQPHAANDQSGNETGDVA